MAPTSAIPSAVGISSLVGCGNANALAVIGVAAALFAGRDLEVPPRFGAEIGFRCKNAGSASEPALGSPSWARNQDLGKGGRVPPYDSCPDDDAPHLFAAV